MSTSAHPAETSDGHDRCVPESRTSSRRPRPRRPLLGGGLGHLALWQVLVEARSGHGWDGFVEALLLTYVGVPVALVLVWGSLRRAGARSAAVGVGALLLVLLLVPRLPLVRELPAVVWPFVLAGLAVGYLHWEAGSSRED